MKLQYNQILIRSLYLDIMTAKLKLEVNVTFLLGLVYGIVIDKYFSLSFLRPTLIMQDFIRILHFDVSRKVLSSDH